jgi:hypothetical protein
MPDTEVVNDIPSSARPVNSNGTVGSSLLASPLSISLSQPGQAFLLGGIVGAVLATLAIGYLLSRR